MANLRAKREQYAASILAKYCVRKDVWLTSCAEIAMWLNGMGFILYYNDALVNANAVARWARVRRMPARAGAGNHRGVQASVLCLIAWLHGPQRCVRHKSETRVLSPLQRQRLGPPMSNAHSSTCATPTLER